MDSSGRKRYTIFEKELEKKRLKIKLDVYRFALRPLRLKYVAQNLVMAFLVLKSQTIPAQIVRGAFQLAFNAPQVRNNVFFLRQIVTPFLCKTGYLS